MKKLLLIATLGLMILNCFSQVNNDKLILGASINYSHDDLRNNRLLSNYYFNNKNLSNTFIFSGEFGYFLSSGNLLAIDIEYLSNNSKQELKTIDGLDPDLLKIKSSGIALNPKYKVIKRFSDKLWFYTDFKVAFQFLSHENTVSQLNVETYKLEYLSMNGKEFKYGLAINPGIIFKINKSLGIKLDYSLFNVIHSTIKKSEDSELDFRNIKAWDYGLNMKLSGIDLGVIFTL